MDKCRNDKLDDKINIIINDNKYNIIKVDITCENQC